MTIKANTKNTHVAISIVLSICLYFSRQLFLVAGMEEENVRALMEVQFKVLGLVGWTFGLDRAKARAGLCNYAKKRITISRHYLARAAEADILDILLHELAHALTPGHGHNDVWRNVAVSLGCSGRRCCASFMEPAYVGFCACQGNVVTRHRLTLRRPVCKKCKCHFFFFFST